MRNIIAGNGWIAEEIILSSTEDMKIVTNKVSSVTDDIPHTKSSCDGVGRISSTVQRHLPHREIASVAICKTNHLLHRIIPLLLHPL
jgi:hypothetical protein